MWRSVARHRSVRERRAGSREGGREGGHLLLLLLMLLKLLLFLLFLLTFSRARASPHCLRGAVLSMWAEKGGREGQE